MRGVESSGSAPLSPCVSHTVLCIPARPPDLNSIEKSPDPTHAKPLGQKKALTPFGSPSVGFFNTTWTDFKAGAPDPTLFVVTGIATCPKSPDCGKGPKQDERLKLGLYHTYRAYAEGSEP